MPLSTPALDECVTALNLFWSKLTLEQKVQLWNNTAACVGFAWTSSTIMDIVRSNIADLWIWESGLQEYWYALERYNKLTEAHQKVIREKLAKYFH